MTDPLQIPPGPVVRPPGAGIPALRAAAQALEANFLAEMLRSAGLGEVENSLSGGPGEDQFASFHRDALARQMAQAGGIGLTEVILNAMMERTHEE